MNTGSDTELIGEVERYLAAVEVFRAERCEPTWLPELRPGAATGTGAGPNGAQIAPDRRHRGLKSSH
jgi:hypothetical protein